MSASRTSAEELLVADRMTRDGVTIEIDADPQGAKA